MAASYETSTTKTPKKQKIRTVIRNEVEQKWLDSNAIPDKGELVYGSDVNTLKIGDGIHKYEDLPAISGGEQGTTDYNNLENKPSINSVTLVGNKTASDLGFAAVATSGLYNDLSGKPTIGNATITFTQGGVTKGSLTTNQTDNSTISLDITNVVDNVTTTSATDALSANMGKELQDEINNLKARGRYLSLWNCATGLPATNPTVSPYNYATGDYFIVGTVAASGQTNYRPNGSSYTIDVASTTVETNAVSPDDTYIYDGAHWILQYNTQKTVSFANIAGQPTDNSNLAAALNAKQDVLTPGNNITIEEDSQTGDLVISSTAQESFFRGKWSNWTSVPTDTSRYPEDYNHNRVPTENDYMVVSDTSDYTAEGMEIKIYWDGWGTHRFSVNDSALVAIGGVNEWVSFNLENDVIIYIKDYEPRYGYFGIKCNVDMLVDGSIVPAGNIVQFIESADPRTVYYHVAGGATLAGTWRFAYHGVWSSIGKNGWLPEYQLEEVLPIATDTEPGITKLYNTTGQNTDGSMTQKSITDAIPTVGNGTITITQGGASKGTFTTNQSGNTTIALDAGGGTVDQVYNATSANAQSGTAVAGAIANKVTRTTVSSGAIVYGENNSGETTFTVTQSANNYALVQRTSTGQITVQLTPIAAWDATSKKYVDDLITTKATITLRDWSINS